MFDLKNFPTWSRPLIAFTGIFLVMLWFFVIPIIWAITGDYDGELIKQIIVYVGIGVLSALAVWIMQQFPKSEGEHKGMAVARYLVPFICLLGANWAYLFFMSLWIEGFSVESIIQISIMAPIFTVCTLVFILILVAPGKPKTKKTKSKSSFQPYSGYQRGRARINRRY